MNIEIAGTILLAGIAGSTAYGLATADSDVDRLGTFAAPTTALLGLSKPDESIMTTKPDVTFHEAGKFVSLLLKCNPTVTELLWLPAELYEDRTPLGDELIAIRQLFLSRKYVRDAYLGYASQQFRRLRDRGDGSFSADTRKRTAKHARHLARLICQGVELYETGHLMVRLEFPDWFREFGERVAAGDLEAVKYELAVAEVRFDEITSPLPERPGTAVAEEWLMRVRREFWDGGEAV